MATFIAETTIRAVRMLTVFADKLSLKRLTAFLAVLSVVTIVNPTFRALHQECPPRKAQCMTARQECQALLDSVK
jgi:hypothetical protein